MCNIYVVVLILRVRSKGRGGKSCLSVLLRESKRVGKKVVSQTLAVLTHMPEWLINRTFPPLKTTKPALGAGFLQFFDFNVVATA